MALMAGKAGLLILSAILFSVCALAATNSSVLSFPPSAYWEGEGGGGTWSTFFLQLGSPAQTVRVLPATSGTSIWTVVPAGCISSYGSSCSDDRGGLYLSNETSSWRQIGIYGLNLFTEEGIGYSGNGQYGFENVTLGGQGDGLPTLENQVIAGIATPQFWLGALPLSPWPVNFTSVNTPQDSLMTSLKKAGSIETLSWGYTAGANARTPQVYGSLTLGGYDTSQFSRSNVTYSFNGDISRDILIPVDRIQISNNDVALSKTQDFYIDSLVPDLWLPDDACDVFEKAFGISMDNETGLYLVNNSQHETLSGQNLSVTFTLGSGQNINTGNSSDDTVDIIMPYFAFDLQAAYPLVQNSTRYFPLRRASDNTTQYILGRAFLQAAYVIADHDHGNFSVHQATWPGSGTKQQLVPILSNLRQTSSDDPSSSGSSSNSISGGAIAGIIIGALAALAIIGVAGFFLWRKRRHPKLEEKSEDGAFLPPAQTADPYRLRTEMDAHPNMTPPALAAAADKMGQPKARYAEADGQSSVFEAPASTTQATELESSDFKHGPSALRLHQNVYEMDSGHLGVPEMDTPAHTPGQTPAVSPSTTHGPQAGLPPAQPSANHQNPPALGDEKQKY